MAAPSRHSCYPLIACDWGCFVLERRKVLPMANGSPQHPASTTPRFTVNWGGSSRCAAPTLRAWERAGQLARDLENITRLKETLRIHVAASADACEVHHAGDIGLQERSAIGGGEAETVDLLFAQRGALTRRVATGLPWSELAGRLARLLRTYQVEGCGKDTFATWTASLSDGELRDRLGWTQPMFDRAPVPAPQPGGAHAG